MSVGKDKVERTVTRGDQTTGLRDITGTIDSTVTRILRNDTKRTWADVVSGRNSKKSKKVVSIDHSIETIQK